MRLKVFILTLIAALTVQAQNKNEICGDVDANSFISSEVVELSIFDTKKNDFIKKSVKAATPEAQDFLNLIAVHGSAVCKSTLRGPRDAPFKICFTGNLKSGQASAIYCGQVKGCTGLNCGGNGFSVGSGSR